jgi:hypothetical protein
MDLPRELVDEATMDVAIIVVVVLSRQEPPAGRMPERHVGRAVRIRIGPRPPCYPIDARYDPSAAQRCMAPAATTRALLIVPVVGVAVVANITAHRDHPASAARRSG